MEQKRTTAKLGYNELLGVAKFVRYNRVFIITEIVYSITHGFGTKKLFIKTGSLL
jgi:hypothetical protein